MYAISRNKRKYSPTPIVRLSMGADGKQQEEIVLISTLKKAEGDAMSERIVRLLNDNLSWVLNTKQKKNNQLIK